MPERITHDILAEIVGIAADAVICIGDSKVCGPPVEDNQPLDCASALAAIRAVVSRGAHVVYG